MKRRCLLGGMIALPAAARAQPASRRPRIGILFLRAASELGPGEVLLISELNELGWVDGRNAQFDVRYTDGSDEQLKVAAEALVAGKPDVIFTYSTGVGAAAQATRTVPIVQATGPDPVVLGYAASLARPGGNVTGMAFFYTELMAKRLEILKDVVPALSKAGVLVPQSMVRGPLCDALEAAAKTLSLTLEVAEAPDLASIEPLMTQFAAAGVQGVVVSDQDLFVRRASAETIAGLALRHRLPTVGALQLVQAGTLLAYGVDFAGQFRRSATFVDRILKGTPPAELPFEQATTFQFVVNLRTARALGLAVSPTVLARANEVIE